MDGTEAAPLGERCPKTDRFSLFDFSSPRAVMGAPFLKQAEGSPPLPFCRMSYRLPDHLSSLPERCEVNSRCPLHFARSLNNSPGPCTVFIFQGAQCSAGIILVILSVSLSSGEVLFLPPSFSRDTSQEGQVVRASWRVAVPGAPHPELQATDSSAFSRKPRWPQFQREP